jgi:hypothetical protein
LAEYPARVPRNKYVSEVENDIFNHAGFFWFGGKGKEIFGHGLNPPGTSRGAQKQSRLKMTPSGTRRRILHISAQMAQVKQGEMDKICALCALSQPI